MDIYIRDSPLVQMMSKIVQAFISLVRLDLFIKDQFCPRLVAWWLVAPWRSNRSMEVVPGCLVATAMLM